MKWRPRYLLIALLILENVLLWYVASTYFQSRAHEIRVAAKAGQAEECKKVRLSDGLYSVLTTMKNYASNIYIDPSGRITVYYGSEISKGFAVGAGVGFVFDETYKLIRKNCEEVFEPTI